MIVRCIFGFLCLDFTYSVLDLHLFLSIFSSLSRLGLWCYVRRTAQSLSHLLVQLYYSLTYARIE
jgi:hypothetical protein